MADFDHLNFEKAKGLIVEAVKPILVSAFAPEDYEWTVTLLLEVILPYRLRAYSSKTGEERKEMVENIITILTSEMRQLEPVEIKKYMQRHKYEALIKEIDRKAYELAVSCYTKEKPLEQLQPEAAELHQRLLEIAKELKETVPEIYREYSKVISESLLDLKYAVAGKKGVSLRLYHFIRASMKGKRGTSATLQLH